MCGDPSANPHRFGRLMATPLISTGMFVHASMAVQPSGMFRNTPQYSRFPYARQSQLGQTTSQNAPCGTRSSLALSHLSLSSLSFSSSRSDFSLSDFHSPRSRSHLPLSNPHFPLSVSHSSLSHSHFILSCSDFSLSTMRADFSLDARWATESRSMYLANTSERQMISTDWSNMTARQIVSPRLITILVRSWEVTSVRWGIGTGGWM